MNKALVIPLALSASLIACGSSPSNEETATNAVTAVGSSVSALTTNAAIADEAATAQSSDNADNPKAPGDLMQSGCVTTQLTLAGLRVDFGTGCTINGHTYAGAYTIGVSIFGGLSVSLDFDSFVVDGRTQQGDMSIGVGRGFVAAHADLAVDDGTGVKEISLDGDLRIRNPDLDFAGTGRYADGTIDVSLTATGLHSVIGACYADAGTITVEAVGYPTAVVTFDANTPSTGLVTVTVGTFSAQQALPTTPRCPAS